MSQSTISTIISTIISLLMIIVWAVGFIIIFISAKKKSDSAVGYIIEKVLNIIKLVGSIIGTLIMAGLSLLVVLVFSESPDLGLPAEVQIAIQTVKHMGYDTYIYIVLAALLVYMILTIIMYAKMIRNYGIMARLVKGIKPTKRISGFAIVMQVISIFVSIASYFYIVIETIKITNSDAMGFIFGDLSGINDALTGMYVGFGVSLIVMNIFPSICEIMLMSGVKKRMQFYRITE